MHRSATIFDSRAEQRLYQALTTRWSDRGSIYPQLPLAKLIELDEQDAGLTRGERNYFYSTNVDFTFCRDNRALLSIEFDGIGGGFSRMGTYVPVRTTEDPHRELKMGLKLRAAAVAAFPFAVVSYDETEAIAPDTSLTVLDSIIGRFLGHTDFQQRFAAGIREAEHELKRMHPDDAQATVDWIGTNAEFDAAWDNDPLTPLAWQEVGRYTKAYPAGSWSVQWLSNPGQSLSIDEVMQGKREPPFEFGPPTGSGPRSRSRCPAGTCRTGLGAQHWWRDRRLCGLDRGDLAQYTAFRRANEVLGAPPAD
jgi:hypothetical protein